MPVLFNGVPWFDQMGRTINAHSAGIIEDAGRYYMFGEYKEDEGNQFAGFSCYSSTDLTDWRFEGLALDVQEGADRLYPGSVGERPKVMRCPVTGQYVMLCHGDGANYMNPAITLAVSDTVTGPYRYVGPILMDGLPIRLWDMGTFQDDDGTGYLLTHEGNIYRLADDYLSIAEQVSSDVAEGGESPAMCHVGDTYYFMLSNKTGWERNDNYVMTAPSMRGPWSERKLFCPEGTRTWNTQCSFILPVNRPEGSTAYLYIGDRWSFPHQASSATLVFMPLEIDADKRSLFIPEYWPAWDPTTFEPIDVEAHRVPAAGLNAPGAPQGRDNQRGTRWEATFETPKAGLRLAVTGHADTDSGYARIRVTDGTGTELVSHVVDFYAPAPDDGIRFVTPPLPQGKLTLGIEVLGETGLWITKNGTRYGGTDTYVDVSGATLLDC